MIDLHLHTTYSDGSLTPTELLERAAVRCVEALAVTDHDTCAGNAEAAEAGARLGIEVISGVELSVAFEGVGLHLLGYGIDCITESARKVFSRLEDARNDRLVKMICRLNELGAPISSEQVRKEAGGNIVGRLHIARLMVRKRLVPSLQAAFTQYLGRGGLAYIDRVRLTPEEAFAAIRDMGGVVVMAHPGVIERENPGVLDRALDCLLGLGLDGIEARYSRHTPEQTARYLEIADRHSLISTGGSDFHSPTPERIEIGRGFGSLSVPYECFLALRSAVEAKRKLHIPS